MYRDPYVPGDYRAAQSRWSYWADRTSPCRRIPQSGLGRRPPSLVAAANESDSRTGLRSHPLLVSARLVTGQASKPTQPHALPKMKVLFCDIYSDLRQCYNKYAVNLEEKH